MMRVQIPDEALLQLRALLETEGGIQWEIGDFIVSYWEEVLKYVKPDEVREAHANVIRQFAHGTGADRSTLRDREKMSMFFTEADRARFPMFTYHQFRALRKAGKDEWEWWAEVAARNNWSVAKIREAIDDFTTEGTEVLLKRLKKLGSLTRKILDDTRVDEEVRESLCLIPTILLDTEELIHEQA
jgi:hypothetical protein